MIRRNRNRNRQSTIPPSPLPESIQYAIMGELRIMTINNQGVDSPIFIM